MTPDASVAEVRRRFNLAPDRVFAAFADPQLVSRWLKPSPEIVLDVLQFDFRIGGAYRFAYHFRSFEIVRHYCFTIPLLHSRDRRSTRAPRNF